MCLGWISIRNNESCPCGSGLPYSKCCKGKTGTPNTSRKPVEVQAMDLMRKLPRKVCLHPDTSACKGNIKKAHALQNNKIISLLAGTDRHVYMQDARRKPIIVGVETGDLMTLIPVNKVSASDATTETCFCDYHDNVAFACIEKGAPDYDGSIQMQFTYAYKAFAFEYYKVVTAMEMLRYSFKQNPAIINDPIILGIYRMNQLKLSEFGDDKAFFDEHILNNNCEGLTTIAVKLQQSVLFADYAYIAPSYDVFGNRIKHTNNGQMSRLSLTIFPEKTQSWLLVSCRSSCAGIYQKLFEQLTSISYKRLIFYLNLLLPLYSENIVLSPMLWESWNEKMQAAYTFYANVQGKEFIQLETSIGFGLKNARNISDEKLPISNINLFREVVNG